RAKCRFMRVLGSWGAGGNQRMRPSRSLASVSEGLIAIVARAVKALARQVRLMVGAFHDAIDNGYDKLLWPR
ncbi:MAG: hypothetical protein CMF64_09735, partial [Magnetovibrio sp.]|nr:hypothetical protein [Magnetovibrio sp.]